jgi:uncharacterized protein YndB with AHSA1/START domain
MHQCQRVDIGFLDTASARFEATVDIAATPEQIFDAFEDAHAWTVWALPITKVEWTSPKPFGVGTTRTVTMTGGMVGEEEFIAWDRGKRMAFCFTGCSVGTVNAFAEDYHVTRLDDGRCRVRWIMAMESAGVSRLMMPLTAPLMRVGLRWMLRRFKAYVEAAPAAEAAAGRPARSA